MNITDYRRMKIAFKWLPRGSAFNNHQSHHKFIGYNLQANNMSRERNIQNALLPSELKLMRLNPFHRSTQAL